jgi:hypothetical protein
MKAAVYRIASCTSTLAALALVTCLLTGCAGVVPLPAFPNKVQHGRRITSEQIAFIQPGLTTRAELETALGTNYIESPREPAIAYTWEISGGGGVWWVSLATPYGGVAKGDTWLGGWRAFFVSFDDNGVVLAAELKRISPEHSLHQHLREWQHALPHAQPDNNGSMFAGRTR